MLLCAAAETLWDMKGSKNFFVSWRTKPPPAPAVSKLTARSNRCFSVGDVVTVQKVREGKAKDRNGCEGTIRSHKAQSPWYMVYFRKDHQTIPVRSQNLVLLVPACDK